MIILLVSISHFKTEPESFSDQLGSPRAEAHTHVRRKECKLYPLLRVVVAGFLFVLSTLLIALGLMPTGYRLNFLRGLK